MFYLGNVTSLFSTVILLGMFKILHLFNWVKWHPTTFLKDEGIKDKASRWLLLGIIVFIICLIIFLALQYVQNVPPFLLSLIIGAAIALMTEWVIYDLPAEMSSFKKLSIPFFVVIITACRFIIDTAIFHRKHLVSRNKLPYNASVIK
ncbi:DNA helicase [Lysinibacillus sp. 54212]|uniref:DNA helicase n=1 Tax=Lysinibacillus sp. 54212 TaxID=3119829 RepID=UPI002FC93D86